MFDNSPPASVPDSENSPHLSHAEDCCCAACGHDHDGHDHGGHDHGTLDMDVIARIITEFGDDLPGAGYDWESLLEWHQHAGHDHGGMPPPPRDYVDIDDRLIDAENSEIGLPIIDDTDLIA